MIRAGWIHRPWLVGILIAWGCPGNSLCLAAETPPDEETHARRRGVLVRILAQEISDRRVLDAMGRVPRHRFVPDHLQHQAYANHPLPIGEGQTISQPFIVAYMTASLRLTGSEKVLEVGTGSGYQAAILAETAGQVYSIEILPRLALQAKARLRALGYTNVHVKVGDGFDGWPQHAPFDAIIVTAAPLRIPAPLIAQLKEGGRLSIPLGGEWDQHLKTYVKREGRLVVVDSLPVRFVPMTGKTLRPN